LSEEADILNPYKYHILFNIIDTLLTVYKGNFII